MQHNANRQVVSQTNWARVKELCDSDAPIPYSPEDGPYDPNDDAAVEAFFKEATITHGYRGKQKKPTKELVSIRLSPAVLEHFRRQGRGWQMQIDQELLRVVEREGAPGGKPAVG